MEESLFVGAGGGISITGANGVGTTQNGGNVVIIAGSPTDEGSADSLLSPEALE